MLYAGIFTIISLRFLENARALSCVRPSGPCEQPVCCNLYSKKYSKHNRNLKIHPMMHHIRLTHDTCSGVCPDTCPKQLGESCGGLWDMHGSCDKQWLRCKYDNKGKKEDADIDLDFEKKGHCVKKHHSNRHKRKEIQKRKTTQNIVPVCEDRKGKIACKCEDPQSNTKLIKTLPNKLRWCFLEQVIDPKNPTKHCFKDVKWSKTDSRFWSYLAHQENKEPGNCFHIIHIVFNKYNIFSKSKFVKLFLFSNTFTYRIL